MAVGVPVTKIEIDSRTGDIAKGVQKMFDDIITMQSYLAATPDQNLVSMGYTSQEVAVIKTAFADLTQLGTIWAGAAALAQAKDFRTFVRQLWGVGSF
jgi:hypothetical protein